MRKMKIHRFEIKRDGQREPEVVEAKTDDPVEWSSERMREDLSIWSISWKDSKHAPEA